MPSKPVRIVTERQDGDPVRIVTSGLSDPVRVVSGRLSDPAYIEIDGLSDPVRIVGDASLYFVDATGGNDANSGRSPDDAWQTIGQVNGETFVPGDYILFKRGETWSGTTLIPPDSGVAGRPITYAAYGSGALPIINYPAGANAFWVGNNVHHIDLQDIRFTANLADGWTLIQLGATSADITIRNCEAYGGNYGVSSNGASPRTRLSYCTMDTNRSGGVILRGIDCIVEGCFVSNFSATLDDQGGIKIHESASKNPIVRHCVVYNGTGQPDLKGIYFDLGRANHNGIIERNIVYNCTFGISSFRSDGALIKNNIVYDLVSGTRTRGLSINDSDDCEAYHNTVYNVDGKAFFIKDALNTAIKNNIFMTCLETPGTVHFEGSPAEGASTDIDNNCYYNAGAFEFEWRGVPYANLAAWVAGTGQDVNSILDNPDFVTPGSNYHLQAVSPCRGAGEIGTGVTDDYDGVTRGSPPDIGAYEYTG